MSYNYRTVNCVMLQISQRKKNMVTVNHYHSLSGKVNCVITCTRALWNDAIGNLILSLSRESQNDMFEKKKTSI